jgi:hypothetical protein
MCVCVCVCLFAHPNLLKRKSLLWNYLFQDKRLYRQEKVSVPLLFTGHISVLFCFIAFVIATFHRFRILFQAVKLLISNSFCFSFTVSRKCNPKLGFWYFQNGKYRYASSNISCKVITREYLACSYYTQEIPKKAKFGSYNVWTVRSVLGPHMFIPFTVSREYVILFLTSFRRIRLFVVVFRQPVPVTGCLQLIVRYMHI